MLELVPRGQSRRTAQRPSSARSAHALESSREGLVLNPSHKHTVSWKLLLQRRTWMPGNEASLYTLPPICQEDGGFSQQTNKEFPQTIKLTNQANLGLHSPDFYLPPLSLPSCSQSHFYSTELALSLKGLLTNWNCRLVAANKIHAYFGWVYHGSWLIGSCRALKLKLCFINRLAIWDGYCDTFTPLWRGGGWEKESLCD